MIILTTTYGRIFFASRIITYDTNDVPSASTIQLIVEGSIMVSVVVNDENTDAPSQRYFWLVCRTH